MKIKKKKFALLKKLHSLDDALNFLREKAKLSTKFDESVDVELVLNIDYKNSTQRLKSFSILPNSVGRICKVAVFYKGPAVEQLNNIRNVEVGFDDLLTKLKKTKGKQFNFVLTTDDYIHDLNEVKVILSRRSLLPSKRDGTLLIDVVGDVQKIQKYQVNYKTDSACSIKSSFGRISYTNEILCDNLKCLLNDIEKKYPSSLRNSLFKFIKISTTMGSCFNVDINSIKFF